MQLMYTDGRLIGELRELRPAAPIGNAPVEFSADVSAETARVLQGERAAFYRASEGDQRFTLTIDSVSASQIAGTIRRR